MTSSGKAPKKRGKPAASCHGEPPATDRQVVQPHKEDLLKRLNRLEGQIRGVAKMIEEDRYCVEVLTQVSAAKSALDAVAMQLLEDHTRGCVRNALRSGRGEPEIEELLDVLRQFRRVG